MKLKLRLIDDWRRFWRWGSVQMAAVAATGAAVLLNVSGAAQAALAAMPAELRSSLPAWLPIAMFVVPTLARVLTFRKKDDGNG